MTLLEKISKNIFKTTFLVVLTKEKVALKNYITPSLSFGTKQASVISAVIRTELSIFSAQIWVFYIVKLGLVSKAIVIALTLLPEFIRAQIS